jgi:hypothetical protein
MISIEQTNARGIQGEFIIILKVQSEQDRWSHCYLHCDGQWRKSCVGPKGMTGYHQSEAAAQATLMNWIGNLPMYRTSYSRKNGEKFIKSRME